PHSVGRAIPRVDCGGPAPPRTSRAPTATRLCRSAVSGRTRPLGETTRPRPFLGFGTQSGLCSGSLPTPAPSRWPPPGGVTGPRVSGMSISPSRPGVITLLLRRSTLNQRVVITFLDPGIHFEIVAFMKGLEQLVGQFRPRLLEAEAGLSQQAENHVPGRF